MIQYQIFNKRITAAVALINLKSVVCKYLYTSGIFMCSDGGGYSEFPLCNLLISIYFLKLIKEKKILIYYQYQSIKQFIFSKNIWITIYKLQKLMVHPGDLIYYRVVCCCCVISYQCLINNCGNHRLILTFYRGF